MGIDWQTDTYDEGLHLNVYGAEKFTEYIGRILSEEHGITSRKGEDELSSRWESHLEEYKNRKKQMEEAN